jgi:hypothetical protein
MKGTPSIKKYLKMVYIKKIKPNGNVTADIKAYRKAYYQAKKAKTSIKITKMALDLIRAREALSNPACGVLTNPDLLRLIGSFIPTESQQKEQKRIKIETERAIRVSRLTDFKKTNARKWLGYLKCNMGKMHSMGFIYWNENREDYDEVYYYVSHKTFEFAIRLILNGYTSGEFWERSSNTKYDEEEHEQIWSNCERLIEEDDISNNDSE